MAILAGNDLRRFACTEQQTGHRSQPVTPQLDAADRSIDKLFTAHIAINAAALLTLQVSARCV
ncbi:hypothetical protein [Sporisorium scitamineum]|uniref:Uncharacterized protein n=1 Tax=Sporisorium scitamineum TaxID=49012 RepID=A0A0F7RWM3_9BASI|nr:hypothetical protein [Sporisorium scitamineum]